MSLLYNAPIGIEDKFRNKSFVKKNVTDIKWIVGYIKHLNSQGFRALALIQGGLND